MNVIVTGSSGFIGTHLVRRLKAEGHFVVGVDIEKPKYEEPHLFFNYDLRNQLNCRAVFSAFQLKGQIDEVYSLACLMGGMGYIGNPEHNYDVLIGSTEIVTNVLDCCLMYGAKKVFYSSSACVYPELRQVSTVTCSLSEDMAYPSSPDLVYGWQKLLSEQMHTAANVSHGLDVRIARFHNIYGPEGTYKGGKEKAPAAICRKVIEAPTVHDHKGAYITLWGDGKQTRSFLYIDDCIDAVRLLMESDFKEPINIGSEEMVSINQLAYIAIQVAHKGLRIEYDLTKPQGVRGRNSDNSLIEKVLGWKPRYSLGEGIEKTYNWILSDIIK